MLQSRDKFSQDHQITMIMRSWAAVDTTTGAILVRSDGRTKSGITHYVLILPDKTIKERGGLFADYHWSNKDRKRFAAWTDSEAIQMAQARLEKMISIRARDKAVLAMAQARISRRNKRLQAKDK